MGNCSGRNPRRCKAQCLEAVLRVPKSRTVLLMLALHTSDEGQSRARKAGFNPYILSVPKARKEICSEEHEISSFCCEPSTPGDHFKAKPESGSLPALCALTSHQLHTGTHTSFDECSHTGAELFLLFRSRVKPHFCRLLRPQPSLDFNFTLCVACPAAATSNQESIQHLMDARLWFTQL